MRSETYPRGQTQTVADLPVMSADRTIPTGEPATTGQIFLNAALAVTGVGIGVLGVRSAHSPGDSNLWHLAYVVPAILLALSLSARSRHRREFASPSRLADSTLVLALVLTTIAGAWFAVEGKKDLDAQVNPDALNACWAEASDQSMLAVACDNPNAGFYVDRYEDMWQKCDDYFIPSADGKQFLCLAHLDGLEPDA